jgi:hypothetical protein
MCGLLFLAGLLRFFTPFDPGSDVPDGYEAVRVARNLADGRGFANPFHVYDTGLTAHGSPVYPFFQAALWRLFGTGDVGNFVFHNVEAVALALQIALLPPLARALHMHASAGLIAAAIGLVPEVVQAHPRWETNYAAVLIMLVTWGMCVFAREEAPPSRIIVCVAFLWGLLILTNPNSVLPYCAWLAWWGFPLVSRRDAPARKRIRPLLILVVIPAVIILPWIVRNYVVFERLIFIRSNLGLELHVSNNPCAQFGVRMNHRTGCFKTVHPNVNITEAQKLVAMGEPAYQQALLKRAINWIQQHPQRFFSLTLQRFWFFWFPSDEGNNVAELLSMGKRRGLHAFVIYLVTLLSLPGLLLLFARNRPSGTICFLWLGVFPLIHYIVQFEDRYRSPILWLTLLLAGFTIAAVLQRVAMTESRGLPDSSLYADKAA